MKYNKIYKLYQYTVVSLDILNNIQKYKMRNVDPLI